MIRPSRKTTKLLILVLEVAIGLKVLALVWHRKYFFSPDNNTDNIVQDYPTIVFDDKGNDDILKANRRSNNNMKTKSLIVLEEPKSKQGRNRSNDNNTKQHVVVVRKEDISRPGWLWDAAPIVVESHKLIFFTVPKVGCTVFKQLFRRMAGRDNWRTKYPHDPNKNGLKYLSSYSLKDATRMMSSKKWTRAIFIRDPKERFLSAYLDKVHKKGGLYIKHHCPGKSVPKNIDAFLNLSKKCYDPHWAPQSKRMTGNFWELIDFVGSFDNAHNDTKVLLERIGAWDQFGKTGWGENRDEEIFGATKTNHATSSSSRFDEFFSNNKQLEKKVEQRYAADYHHETIAKVLEPHRKQDR